MICTATTQATRAGREPEEVRCTKDADHVNYVDNENHWGLTADGMDVVWSEVTLRPPARKQEG